MITISSLRFTLVINIAAAAHIILYGEVILKILINENKFILLSFLLKAIYAGLKQEALICL